MTRGPINDSVLADLRIEDEDGDYYAAVGTTLTMMYAQRMQELVPIFSQMINRFSDFILPHRLESMKPNEEWRDYSPNQLKRLLNRFMSNSQNGAELLLADLSDPDGPFQYFGEYGLRIKGRGDEKDSPFRSTDVCAVYFELPIDEVSRSGRDSLLSFVHEIADLAPFQHGMCGYTFKYFHREGSSEIYDWIGDKALRYSAVHPFMNSFEYYSRHRLPNVNWVTLLGKEVERKLGGSDSIRNQLTSDVECEALQHGTMLIAGHEPPLGDSNQGATDVGPLRAVAKLVRPLLLDAETQRNNILNSLFHDEEQTDADRWLRRFDE